MDCSCTILVVDIDLRDLVVIHEIFVLRVEFALSPLGMGGAVFLLVVVIQLGWTVFFRGQLDSYK